MPIIKSAIKRVRQEEKRRARNTAAKRRIKATTKQTLTALAEKDLKIARSELAKAISQIDKAIKKGVFHKNTGARRKSSLTRQYNTASNKPYGTDVATTKKTVKKPTTKQTASKKTTK